MGIAAAEASSAHGTGAIRQLMPRDISRWERMPIMRKDVKLGLAVGGVLLAVLVVYALVVPGNNGNQPGADVALSESGGSTGSDSTGAGATDTNTSTAQGTAGARDTAT